MITTIAGGGASTSYAGDGDAATSASLNCPIGITLDSTGTLSIISYFIFDDHYCSD